MAHMNRCRFGFLFLVTALLLRLTALASTDFDALIDSLSPYGYVNDYANVLPASEERSLEALLNQLAKTTGTEVAIVTLSSLNGGEINDFASRLYEKWGIGKKGSDKGALLLTSMKDRKARIETGYGLEGVLPDARVGRILDQYLIPRFREGHYSAGITATATALSEIIAKDAGVQLGAKLPATHQRSASRQDGRFSILHLLFLLIMIPVIIRHPWLLLFLLNNGRGGGFSGGGFGGGGFSGFGGGLSGGGGASRGW